MELREAIKEAMKEAHGLSQGDRVIISCDYNDWDNGWEVFSTMGTQEEIHPDKINEKFYYSVSGWNIDNEENYQTPEGLLSYYYEDEAKRILEQMPKDMENPVYDTECNEWVEHDDWVNNAVEVYAGEFLDEFQNEIMDKFMNEKEELEGDLNN